MGKAPSQSDEEFLAASLRGVRHLRSMMGGAAAPISPQPLSGTRLETHAGAPASKVGSRLHECVLVSGGCGVKG